MILTKLLQRQNEPPPMLVTEFGIVMFVKLSQPENAYSPMLVTDAGMITLVKLWQPEKASSPMLVTEFGIIEFSQPRIKVFVDVLIIALQLFRLSYTALSKATLMLVKQPQLENA